MQVEHTLTYVVDEKWNGHTVRSILLEELKMARQVLTRLKRSGEVLKNGVDCYMRDNVNTGDVLTVIMREELEQDIAPESIPIEVVFEDEHILVVNKPSGLVVHPTKGYMSGTLANGVLNHWRKRAQHFAFRPVHRLDRDTSGLIVIAKNPYIQESLTMQHHTREWRKHYLCVVTGVVPKPCGEIDAPIARVGNGSRARIISTEGKAALTIWKRVKALSNCTLIRAELVTGRTHQIRVHFAHIGHPLVGDEVYGSPSPLIARHALHAAEVSFFHPVDRIRITLFSPLPSDMSALLQHMHS